MNVNPKPKPPMPGGEYLHFSDPGTPPLPPGIKVVGLIPVGDGGPYSVDLANGAEKLQIRNPTVEECAWAAGFFEGEGSISITKDYTLHARITQVDREPLEKLKELFSGPIRNHTIVRGNRKTCQVWNIINSRVIDFLSAIEKFVVRDRLKKRIEMARTFHAVKNDSSMPKKQRQARMQELYDEFKRSNKTGIA